MHAHAHVHYENIYRHINASTSNLLQMIRNYVSQFIKPSTNKNNMEMKHTKFFPSKNIDELKQTIVDQFLWLGGGKWYSIPEKICSCTKVTWFTLMFDCFFPVSFNCLCHKCLTATTLDIYTLWKYGPSWSWRIRW